MDEPQQAMTNLWIRLHENEEDVNALLTILAEVHALVEQSPQSKAYDLLAATFHRLQEATLDLPQEREEIILQDLLPWLTRDENLEREDASAYARSEARRTLRTWLDQYPSAKRHQLIQATLDSLVGTLRERPSVSACWTISALAYRRQDIVDALWHVASLDSQDSLERSDVAFRALANLALAGDKRKRLLSALHEHFTIRPTWPLISALQDLSDPSSVPVIVQALQQHLSVEADIDGEFPVDFSTQALTEIANRHGNDTALQTQVWDKLITLFEASPGRYGQAVYLGGYTAPRCDTPQVIADLARLLQRDPGDSESERYRRYLLYLRMLECRRPHQLRGFRERLMPSARGALWQDATQGAGEGSRWGTMQSNLRMQAWHVLLTTGDERILEPDKLAQMLVPESNIGLMHEVLNDVASFQLDELPPILTTWITQERKLLRGGSAPDVSYRIAAIHVARSAATLEAFHALMQCGLSFEDFAMQEAVSALASVSLSLIEHPQGRSVDVIGNLLDVAQNGAQRHHRTAAMYALWRLATAEVLPISHLGQIAAWAEDPERTDFERSRAIQILGGISWDMLPLDTQTMIVRLARSTDESLPESVSAAFEALVISGGLLRRLDLLALYTPITIEGGDEWTFKAETPTTDRTFALIADLYVQDPQRMSMVMASSLQMATFFELDMLLNAITAAHQTNGSPPTQAVLDALLDLLRRVGQPTLGPSSARIFEAVAVFAPSALVAHDWTDRWDTWSPEDRQGFADALGRSAYTMSTERKAAIRLLMLLMRDAHFGVRRSTYRSLLAIAPQTLREFAVCAALVPVAAWRQRAAEALEWVTNSDIPTRTQRALALDHDPVVRDALEHALERRRRRQWAEAYVGQLRHAIGKGNTAWLRAWRYLRALAEFGDDTIMTGLRTDLANRLLTPSERHMLNTLLHQLEEHWKKEIEAWPKPTREWQGAIEMIEATINARNAGDETSLLDGVPCIAYLFELPSDSGAAQTGQWFGACWPRRSDALLRRRDLRAVLTNLPSRLNIAGILRQQPLVHFRAEGAWIFRETLSAFKEQGWR